MKGDTIIVCVTASFSSKEELLATLKKYAISSDGRFAQWGEFAFTTELLPECDAILVFNTPGENIRTSCAPENIIAMMMEPGVPAEHPWMFTGLDQYQRVYSPVPQSSNTIPSHGFLGWYFTHDYNYLKKLVVPTKTKVISCIASNLKQLQGHRLRFNFIEILRQQVPSIDFFGKGTHFLQDKMEGLLPYRYSIAIENAAQPYYFTEKINDCFLAYTVPVYYGCKNLDKYFPAKSFIQIDIENTREAIKKINDLFENDDWQSRLEFVKEARELVLEKYQPLAGAATIFREMQLSSNKKNIMLKPVRQALIKRIKTAAYKLLKN